MTWVFFPSFLYVYFQFSNCIPPRSSINYIYLPCLSASFFSFYLISLPRLSRLKYLLVSIFSWNYCWISHFSNILKMKSLTQQVINQCINHWWHQILATINQWTHQSLTSITLLLWENDTKREEKTEECRANMSCHHLSSFSVDSTAHF